MATYKLIQDIEAEDHILGPLTFRQFVFALIAAFLIYLNVFFVIHNMAFFVVILLPPAMFFTFFALPLGRDQSTEVWALAKLRFYFKPRKRIWNQSGVKELVTITAPKRVEPVRTNGLSQTEVRSRLKALADTIDTRGWAVKNVSVNAFTVPAMAGAGSDRLVGLNDMAREVPEANITAADDMLDEVNNPVAQQFNTMINQSTQAHRQQLMNQLNDLSAAQQQTSQPADYWFMTGSGQMAQPIAAPQAAAIDPATEAELSSELKKAKPGGDATPYGHLRTLKPIDKKTPVAPAKPAKRQSAPMTAAPDPAILSLANNDDLN
ncbi:MAG: PrgI family protein, partial [Candidatus Saccharimonadales bacterium]